MPETYVKEDLEALDRVDLRRVAVKVLGITNQVATSHKSDKLIEMIIEKQGDGKGKGKAAPLPPKGGGKPASKAKETPKEEEETDGGDEGGQEEAPPKGKTAAVPADRLLGKIFEHVQAIGKEADKNNASIQEQLAALDKRLFIVSGLIAAIFKSTFEPDELDTCISDLEKQYDEQGGEDEGNE